MIVFVFTLDIEFPGVCFGLAVVVGLPGFIGYVFFESNAWDAYAKQHQCRVINVTSGNTTTGIVGGKVVVLNTLGETSYQCNDGVTYTR
jgi:hypothetical protein